MIHIDSLVTVHEILECLTTPEDVFAYLSLYRKKFAEEMNKGEEPWIIYSSEGCYINAKPGTPGWRPLQSCLGCQLVCRMTHSSHFPEYRKPTNVGGKGSLRNLMFQIDSIDQSKRDKVVKWFTNSCFLDKILKPLNTRSTALFVYECNGRVIKIDEIPGIGFSFAGLRTIKDFNEEKFKKLLQLSERIDNEMRQSGYRLKNYSEEFLAFEKSESGINIRIFAHSEDTINLDLVSQTGIKDIILTLLE